MLLFLALLATEVLIALFVHDDFVRPYLGDVLVVPVIFYLLRAAFPERIKLLPLYIFLFAAAVEVGQYFNIVKLLHTLFPYTARLDLFVFGHSVLFCRRRSVPFCRYCRAQTAIRLNLLACFDNLCYPQV